MYFDLLDRTSVVESDSCEYLYTPLQLATRAGHIRCMVYLLQKDPSRKHFADARATFGAQGFSSLALTKDSSCINVKNFTQKQQPNF